MTAYLAAEVHEVLAVLSIVSHGAGAAVGAQAVSAGASIFTRLRVALILLELTEIPVKTRTATAREAVNAINASPIIQAGALSTFGDVAFTQDPIKALSALAHKAVDVVPADGTVPAGLAGTLVYLSLTAIPFKPRLAVTGETPNLVHTRASIQAWVRRAVVNVYLTIVSAVSRLTSTRVAARAVHATTTIFAGVLFAFIHIVPAACTLPTSRTLTCVRGVVCRWATHSSPLTWMRGTRNLFHLTVFTCEWLTTSAVITVDSIYTNALVQTRLGCTFIDVPLTAHTYESRLALTGVAIMSVHTGATILARIGLAFILFLLTLLSHPASFTLTAIPVLLFNTFSVHTRLRSTVVGPREAQRAVGAGWTEAVEPVDLVLTGSPTHTWVGVTLVDLHVTFNSCISRGAHTFVLVNSIVALSVLTGVAGTVVFIDLTVHPCGSLKAVTLVGID